MLDFNAKYSFNRDFELMERSGKYIYVNFNTADWLRTNECGRNIIDSCDGDSSLGDIAEKFAINLGIPANVIRESCHDFLEKAINAGLIYTGESLPKIENRIIHMRSPETIWIHVSAHCNLSCPFCYSESSAGKKESLDCERALSFLKQTREDQRGNIIISGGEPFLYEKLEELLAGIKYMGFKTTQIITNGTVGHTDYKNVCSYIDRLQFSIDGTTAEINDMTRGNGSFEMLLEGIRMANECDFRYKILSFTATANNVHQIPELPAFAIEHDMDQINISSIVPVGRGGKIDLAINDNEYTNYLEEFLSEYEKAIKSGHNIHLSIAEDISEKLIIQGRRHSCGMADSLISICYNGKIYPCPSLHDDKFVIGSYTDSLEKIIEKGHRLNNRFCVESKESGCSNCKYRYFCGSGCLAKKNACKDGSYCERCIHEINRLFEFIG